MANFHHFCFGIKTFSPNHLQKKKNADKSSILFLCKTERSLPSLRLLKLFSCILRFLSLSFPPWLLPARMRFFHITFKGMPCIWIIRWDLQFSCVFTFLNAFCLLLPSWKYLGRRIFSVFYEVGCLIRAVVSSTEYFNRLQI